MYFLLLNMNKCHKGLSTPLPGQVIIFERLIFHSWDPASVKRIKDIKKRLLQCCHWWSKQDLKSKWEHILNPHNILSNYHFPELTCAGYTRSGSFIIQKVEDDSDPVSVLHAVISHQPGETASVRYPDLTLHPTLLISYWLVYFSSSR